MSSSAPDPDTFRYLAQAVFRGTGRPEPEERAVLLRAAQTWGVRPRMAAQILSQVAKAPTPLSPPTDRKDCEEILNRAAEVALADGNLAGDERRYLKRLARNLDLEEAILQAALARAEQTSQSDVVQQPAPEEDVSWTGNPIHRYRFSTPSGARKVILLFSTRRGFQVLHGERSSDHAYSDVQSVTLELREDESCVCTLGLPGISPVEITNVTTRGVRRDYEYVEFLNALHTVLRLAKAKPRYGVRHPVSHQEYLNRLGVVAIPGLLAVFLLSVIALLAEQPILLCGACLLAPFLVGAAVTLARQIWTRQITDYDPPDFPPSVLPGAEDITVEEALTAGVLEFWLGALRDDSDWED